MRTEEQIRDEIARLEQRAKRYESQRRTDEQADMESDAHMLRWALGEED